MSQRHTPYRWALLTLLLLCTILWPTFTYAEKIIPKRRERPGDRDLTGWAGTADMALSYNLLGLQFQSRFGYRWQLYKHPHRALEANFFHLGPLVSVTPANFRGGAFMKLQPVSFLNFGVSYYYQFFLPAFSVGTVFQNIREIDEQFKGTTDFLDGQRRVLQRMRDVRQLNGGSRVGMRGHTLRFEGTFQIKIKRFVAAFIGQVAMTWMHFEAQDNYDYWYDPVFDLFGARQDLLFNSVAFAGYEIPRANVMLLVAHTFAKSFGTGDRNWAIGPAVRWEITKRWRGFRAPFLIFVTRWYLAHKFREGPFPNIAVLGGVQF